MAKPRLTVCIITRDEEAQIGRLLESVLPMAAEIIVVDTGSTDRTPEIAAERGARVIHHPWRDDFAEARNVSLSHATGDWILVLDADEALPPETARKLPGALTDQDADGYLMPVINYVDGAATSRTAIVRLFRNRPAYRYTGRIHEQVVSAIEANGGKIKALTLEIAHYGYNPSEDARKGRRERNIRLLQQSLAEEPNEASTWYFLGVEQVALSEYGEALQCFQRARSLGGGRLIDAYAAHRLVEITLHRHELVDSWELALQGKDHPVTRWDSLVRLAQIALHEGDHVTTQEALAKLRRASSSDYGHATREPGQLLDWEATALWEQGRRAEALRLWQQGVTREPSNHHLATQWVRHRTQVEGLRTGTLGSAQLIKSSNVLSAAIGAFLRAGELELAANLLRSSGDTVAPSPYALYALACGGSWAEAERLAETNGLEGAIHLAGAAFWFGQQESLERAVQMLPGSWRIALEVTLAGEPVPEGARWALEVMMPFWADAGCGPILLAAAASLFPEEEQVRARVARLLFAVGMEAQAVELAIPAASQPEAQEVLGRATFQQGDWATAAQFLTSRIEAGPAAVRVYRLAAEALARMGKRVQARAVLAEGLTVRPHSALLKKPL